MTLPITSPALFFTVLVFIALFVPMVFDRLRLPGIVGLILTAMLLGPYGAGVLENNSLISYLGQAGLLFIVFVAGLEIDLGRFAKYRHHSIVFGSLSFLIPQIAGTLIAWQLLDFGLPSAILLGSMFGSHTLLAYPVASRLGITKTTAVTTSVGGTIITDVAALMVLAIIANSTRGQNDWMFWGSFALFLFTFLFLVFRVLPPAARWFYRTVPDEGARDFMFTILMVFTFAFLAEFAGLQPIIGAFLCGIALNRLIPERSPLMNRIQFVGRTLLVPIFLVSVGMLVDPMAIIADKRTLLIVATMSVTVVATKWLAAIIAGKILRYSWNDCWVLFGMSVSQAAATLAAVVVGYEIGLFDSAVVNGAIVMILISCLIGPSCTAHWGSKLAQEAEHGQTPWDESGQRILIPVANPASVEPLMDLALLIREPKSQQPIFPLAVVTEASDIDIKMIQAEKMLALATVRGATASASVFPITRVDVNIAEGIRRTLVEQQITTVIIGWNGQISLANKIFGGVLDQLLAQSRQQIIVSRITQSIKASGKSKVILVIPRSAEREHSFQDSVHVVKVLCQQLSSDLHIVGPSADKPKVQKLLTQVRPKVKMSHQVIPLLRNLLDDVSFHEEDLLVLLSARHHRLSWTPALETLPRKIAEKHPQLPFLVIYPAEEFETTFIEQPEEDRQSEHLLLSPSRIRLGMQAEDMREALTELLSGDYTEKPVLRDRMTGALYHSAYEYPLEIREGVYILHIHDASVQEPRLYMASAATGFNLPNQDPKARLVLALISPTSASPAKHLRVLNRIASEMRDDDKVRKLFQSQTPEAAMQALPGINEL